MFYCIWFLCEYVKIGYPGPCVFTSGRSSRGGREEVGEWKKALSNIRKAASHENHFSSGRPTSHSSGSPTVFFFRISKERVYVNDDDGSLDPSNEKE